MTPLQLRPAALLAVVVLLALCGIGSQVAAKKHSEEDADMDADAASQNVGVMALTADSFKAAASSLPLLVYYYAKWCKHCVTTGPMIEALAVLLRDRDDLALQVAKVDVEDNNELVQEQGVNGFPTIRMYRDGRHDDFYGERSVPNLMLWLERKMGLAVETITSMKQAREMFAEHPVVVVGFFKDMESEEAALFKAASTTLDKTAFAHVADEDLMAELGAEDGTVAVFKQFDEGRVDVPLAHTEDSLVRALRRSSRPLVADFRSEAAQEHFTAAGTGNRSVLVAFVSRRAGHYEQLRDALQAVALERVNDVSFLTVDVDRADSAVVLTAFSMTNATALPALRMYTFTDAERYRPATDRVNADVVRDFIAGVESGAVKPLDVAAAEEADLVENDVRVLTAGSFERQVFDGRRHALVMFYTETCPHCIVFKTVFEEVASQLADQASLVMAKINMGKSRPKTTGVDIVGVPFVVLYPRSGKHEPVVFDGTRNAEALLKFIKKHTGLQVKKSRSAKGKAAAEDREEL